MKNLEENCRAILEAYKDGSLGQTIMPEDSHPLFSEQDQELKLCYFTLPMSLNYQRDSYKLWEAALKTYQDKETRRVFDIEWVANATAEEVRECLLKYKVALQPNKHIATWQTLAKTLHQNWGSIDALFAACDYDFLILRETVQKKRKKEFPYLSGPKIFNYWTFIMQKYGGIRLKNAEHIDIAPDTHVIKCSVILGVITQSEAESLTKEQIADRWRVALDGTGITPADMHSPLWFWSRNGFIFTV